MIEKEKAAFLRGWKRRHGHELRQAIRMGGRKRDAELRRLARLFRLEWQRGPQGA